MSKRDFFKREIDERKERKYVDGRNDGNGFGSEGIVEGGGMGGKMAQRYLSAGMRSEGRMRLPLRTRPG